MRRYYNITILVLALLLFWSCRSTKNDLVNNSKESQLIQLKELVASRSFKFKADTAYPMQTYDMMQVTNALLRNTGNTAGRISLMGNGDYITVKGDTVQAELAYFGERRMGFNIDPQDIGIHFEGNPSDYVVIENTKKKTLNIEFKTKSKTEQYDVIMSVYPSKSATVYISSTNRTSMRYDGEIVKLDETDKTTKPVTQ